MYIMCWGVLVVEYLGIFIGCDNFQGGKDVIEYVLFLCQGNFVFIGDVGDKVLEF